MKANLRVNGRVITKNLHRMIMWCLAIVLCIDTLRTYSHCRYSQLVTRALSKSSNNTNPVHREQCRAG